ncbi:MAG: NAD-binding protein [Spirochaetota bacterium]
MFYLGEMFAFRRFLYALILILIVIAGGTVGYSLIEGWSFQQSLYMTFITISTVGYGEVRPLTEAGRIFTMIFIILGLMTIGFALTTLISFIFEGQFLTTMKERRMKRFLSVIRDHYIICGFGDVGRETAEEFQRKKIRFLVVDNDISEADMSRYSDVGFVVGDATEEEFLKEARIDRARGLISCLPDDQQNVFVVLTARQLNPSLMIVSKASDERTVNKLQTAGADRVISPKQIAGRRLAAVSIRPSIVNFLEVLSSGGDESVRIESIRVVKNSPLIGKSLKESNIGQHTGAVIIGILGADGQARMNQSSLATLSSIKLEVGNELIALGNEEQITSLEKFAAGRT